MERWFALWVRQDLCARLHFPVHKPPAMVTLDDRAITFTGTWPDMERLRTFQPWTRNTSPPHEQPPAVRAQTRTETLDRALALLDAQIKYLSYEPDMQAALEEVWMLLQGLRHEG
jgi:hypothetical protein